MICSCKQCLRNTLPQPRPKDISVRKWEGGIVSGMNIPENIIYATRWIYLLLAEFSVRTVNFGPSFVPSIYGPRAKRHSTRIP